MLTPEDIENLTKYQKEVFVTKEDVEDATEEIKTSLLTLVTSVDNIAKDVKILKDEKLVRNDRIKNLENWTDIASPKLGLEFKH